MKNKYPIKKMDNLYKILKQNKKKFTTLFGVGLFGALSMVTSSGLMAHDHDHDDHEDRLARSDDNDLYDRMQENHYYNKYDYPETNYPQTLKEEDRAYSPQHYPYELYHPYQQGQQYPRYYQQQPQQQNNQRNQTYPYYYYPR